MSPRDIRQCLESFLIVTSSVGGEGMLLATSRQRPEMLLNISQFTRTVPTTKNYLIGNIYSGEVEKPRVRGWGKIK